MPAEPGDLLIRRALGDGFDVVEAASGRHLASYAAFSDAFRFAATQGGAIWQQRTDGSGRPLGEPILAVARRR